MDWKSLTIPASFPITTDYFPAEAATFKREYLVTEYAITPDEILGELVAPRGRRMLGNEEIFRELVSQRLAQGFQLIDLGQESSACYKEMNRKAKHFKLSNLSKFEFQKQ